MENKNKLTKKDKNYIFTIIIITIVLFISLFFNFIGGFNRANIIQYSYEIGDEYILNIDSIGAYSKSFILKGTSLPTDIVKHKFSVKTPNFETNNLILRAKVKIYDKYINLYGFDNWELNIQDNYYYYIGEMYPNQKIGLCNEIEWNDLDLKSNVIYLIDFTIELYYENNIVP